MGSWTIVELLKQGYSVRTTIRNLACEQEVRAMIGGEAIAGDRLSFFAADLLHDAGWERAADGAQFVLHVASPMPIGEYRGQDVITPARQGMVRVLKAAARAAVKRTVITSSTAAAMRQSKKAGTLDEHLWTDLPDKPIYNYPRSKTLAEQDAWAFIRDTGSAMELSSILPSSILGPVLGPDYSASIDIVALMLKGKLPMVPRIGFGIVDIRDLADLHIRAMTAPAAAGERFIATGQFLWFSDIAALLRDKLGKHGAKAPRLTMPDFLVRAGALFNPEMAQLAPNLGVRYGSVSSKAETMLGWRTRAAETSIIDTANSLIEQGLA